MRYADDGTAYKNLNKKKMNNQPTTNAEVAMPKRDSFEYKYQNTIDAYHLGEGNTFPIAEDVKYPPEGGIYVYYKGMPFPKKGFPYPEAVWHNDILKRVTLTIAKTFANKYMLVPLSLIVLMPWFMKKSILEGVLSNFVRIGEWLFMGDFLKADRYSNPARGLRKMLTDMCMYLHLDQRTVEFFPLIVSNMLEYDDAYRYRFQDLMTEASRQALMERPLREVLRIIKIGKEREQVPLVQATMKAVYALVLVGLMHPKIKRAFKFSIRNLSPKEFKWMQLDNADRYHVLRQGGYNFLGRTDKERRNIYIDFHTKSNCCNAGVIERRVDDKDKYLTICKLCRSECTWRQEFPPEVTIAPK